MSVLIIDNNIDEDSWGSSDLRRVVHSLSSLTLTVRRAPHDDLPSSHLGFERIIISGSKTSPMDDSPWIFKLHEFIRAAVNDGKPLLGVCFGHQTLIRALGGKELMRHAVQAEFGWTEIEVLAACPIFARMPKTFYSFSSHFDEASALPPSMIRLARSPDCEIQACQVAGRPAFGIQFHPEKDLLGAESTLKSRKKLGTPPRLLHPERSKELYDPSVGDTLFGNFLKL